MILPEATEWRRVYSWVFGRTGIELHPEYGSDWWFVVDVTDFDQTLSDALPFEQARAAAERIARKRRPDLFPTEPTPKKEPAE